MGIRLDTGEGLRMTGFTPDSPARRAGLEVGDRILAVAGQRVRDYSDLRLALLDTAPARRAPSSRSASNGGDALLDVLRDAEYPHP